MSDAELQFNKEFDVVFSNSVLHWIKNQDALLQSIYHCLKPGGRIGLQFPLLNPSHPMVSLVEAAVRSLKLENRYTDWEFPWNVPNSTDTYIELLDQSRFKNIAVRKIETSYTFETAPVENGIRLDFQRLYVLAGL